MGDTLGEQVGGKHRNAKRQYSESCGETEREEGESKSKGEVEKRKNTCQPSSSER